MTVKTNRLNKDTRGQEHLSVAAKVKTVSSRRIRRVRIPWTYHRVNKNGESNSHIRRDSLKQNSHIAITRAEQSQHQADRSLAFIR